MVPAVWTAVVVPLVACASQPEAGSVQHPRSINVVRAGDTTYAFITDEPVNRDCAAYCKRLSACWQELPGADPVLTEDQVQKKCLSENQDCRTPTVDTHCCGAYTDCHDFAVCRSRSHETSMDCSKPLP